MHDIIYHLSMHQLSTRKNHYFHTFSFTLTGSLYHSHSLSGGIPQRHAIVELLGTVPYKLNQWHQSTNGPHTVTTENESKSTIQYRIINQISYSDTDTKVQVTGNLYGI